jgi:hypothetical protein
MVIAKVKITSITATSKITLFLKLLAITEEEQSLYIKTWDKN